ncbi:MAG: preprotein translocase subunit SecE [Actinomycetota bacterium]|jgi:preprotein translocase subunit SecE|nr:preprotein translocase subunit SecE [Actinomycetota bacterium]
MGNRRGSTVAKGGGRGKTQEKKAGRFSGTVEFVRGVRSELKKVTWPNRDQLQQSTAVVLIILVILTAYVFLWDTVFYYLARLIFT